MRRLLLGLVLLLSACGPQLVSSDVTRFHSLPPVSPVGGQSFTIVAEGDQIGSLEFQQYASLVQMQLQRLGYRPVPPDGRASDLIVHLDYGVDQGRTQVWQEPSTRVGFGYGHGHHHGHRSSWSGVGVGVPLGGWDYPRVHSYTLYGSWLEVEMIDAQAARANRVQKLFEGRAVAETGGRNLPGVMPYLAAALFTGFPGANGQTVKVQVPVAGS